MNHRKGLADLVLRATIKKYLTVQTGGGPQMNNPNFKLLESERFKKPLFKKFEQLASSIETALHVVTALHKENGVWHAR